MPGTFGDQSKEYLKQLLLLIDKGIGGKSISVTPTITTTNVPYSSGDVVGGLITLTGASRASSKTSILKSIHIKDDNNQKQPLTFLLFNVDPSTGATIIDNTAFAYGSSALSKQICKVNVDTTDYETIDSKGIADIDNFNKVISSNNGTFYLIILTTGTPTFGANSTSLQITFNFLQD